MNKTKNIFEKGAISPSLIGKSIAAHSEKTEIGAHHIFLGQIRADKTDGKTVKAIEYTAYEDLALTQMALIREEIFEKYKISCMHIHHSLGIVNTGKICLFVMISSQHRTEATNACIEVVERIKKELPIWGKEIFEDETHQWKTNR